MSATRSEVGSAETATTAETAESGRTTDVADPDAVADVVRTFYAAVAQDDLLGPLFCDVAQVDWSEHLPKLTAFWCRALFALPGYQGNPYARHQEVHARSPFTDAHFDRWLELFEETIDEGWAGERAETMKAFARRVAAVHRTHIVGGA